MIYGSPLHLGQTTTCLPDLATKPVLINMFLEGITLGCLPFMHLYCFYMVLAFATCPPVILRNIIKTVTAQALPSLSFLQSPRVPAPLPALPSSSGPTPPPSGNTAPPRPTARGHPASILRSRAAGHPAEKPRAPS